MASRTNRVLTDHNEIRRWAEERNASPACVRGTGSNNDIGILRLDFPGYTGAQSLEHIDWGEWFNKFDERGVALLVQESTARGERSNFNKIISRETAASSDQGRSRTAGRSSRASAGRRATSRARVASSTRSRSTSRKKSAEKRTSAKSASRRSSSTRTARAAAARGTSRKTGASRSHAGRKASASTRSNATRARRNTGTRAQSSRKETKVRSIESGRGRSSSHVLTDHDEIRRWAEERGAAPACVRGTGGANDPGMIRLDFPGFSGARSLEHIDWDKWFRAFDSNGLALLVQDTRAGGGTSNFNKLIARETAARGSRSEGKSSRGRVAKTSSQTRATSSNKATKKPARGSTRAHRTESVRGRTTSQRRAA